MFFASENRAKNYVFIDNSKSITNYDSSATGEKIDLLIDSLNASQQSSFIYHTFSNDIRQVSEDSINSIKYDQSSTNFENIFDYMDTVQDDIASVIIVSDGLINSGLSPLSSAGDFNYPVITVGIGDTTIFDDLQISGLDYNDIIYAGKKSEIKASIYNSSQKPKTTVLELYDENSLLESKVINLKNESLTEITFDYTPASEGTKILKLRLQPFPDEKNTANNTKMFSVDVLSSKIKTAIISGTPSIDAAYIRNSLSENDRFQIFPYTLVGENKFSEENVPVKLDDIDLIILSSFPSAITPGRLIEEVSNKIQKDNTPFLLQITNKTDLNKLESMQINLGFSVRLKNNSQLLIQPSAVDNIQYANSFAPEEEWQNLPPINVPDFLIQLSNRTIPLLVNDTNNQDGELIPILALSESKPRSITIFGYNIWKWKLQTKDEMFFNNLIFNIANWLNTDKQLKKFRVATDKKVYRFNENVDFTARVYDELLKPIDDASVSLEINQQNETVKQLLDNKGNGDYQLSINSLTPGKYSFKAEVLKNSEILYRAKGSFVIDSVSVEELNKVADFNFLRSLSQTTKGKFYYIQNVSEIKEYFENNPLNKISTEYSEESYEPKNYSIIMLLIISLFSVEWFIKKRIGLN